MNTDWTSVQPGPAAAAAEESPRRSPQDLLHVVRGFSCLFWSMALVGGAHAIALAGLLPTGWAIGILAASFWPLGWGLWILPAGEHVSPRWKLRVGRALGLAVGALLLSPFIVWWWLVPTQTYFAVNAALQYVLQIALLAALNHLAGEGGRWLEDRGLRREARAGIGMVVWLSGCTVAALGLLFHRAGLLTAGLPAVLSQLALLPREARALLLLPYAMTAYVMWRAKESGLRRLVPGGGPLPGAGDATAGIDAVSPAEDRARL